MIKQFEKIVIYIPLFTVLLSIFFYLVLNFAFDIDDKWLNIIIFIGIIAGSFKLVIDTVQSILRIDFGLDYIAILAILVAIITGQLFIALIIVLMLTGGETLEEYAQQKARRSIRSLVDRLPDTVLKKDGERITETKIEFIKKGEIILVRKGEVIPLDGLLNSDVGFIDESAVTGEPFFEEKLKGGIVRSGTVNKGEAIEIIVLKIDKESTFRKIIEIVKKAQEDKSPMLKMADKYSLYFTILSLTIAAFAFIISGFDIDRVLAVLVIATPCPLILAAPVAMIGGVNSAASKRIIIKSLDTLERLSKVDTLIFDKTGTLTFGEPVIDSIEVYDQSYSSDEIIKISASLERASLHPFAKAIVKKSHSLSQQSFPVVDLKEIIGKGIEGKINQDIVIVEKSKTVSEAIDIVINEKQVASIKFKDVIKIDTKNTIQKIINSGYSVHVLSGDHSQKVKMLINELKIDGVSFLGDCKPEDKKEYIQKLKSEGRTIAMVGDGINDAAALAFADVGIAFVNDEQTITSEVSDVLLLGSDVGQILGLIDISKRTVSIAKQSIFIGIALSTIGMTIASFGFIIPLVGAIIQEAIDVGVILNGIRTSSLKLKNNIFNKK